MTKYLILFLLTFQSVLGQKSVLKKEINEILNSRPSKPFSGVILIQKCNKTLYKKVEGFSGEGKLSENDKFVVGSISKQFSGALVLREIDAGRLDATLPIKRYLPYLTQTWADTVTTHHLITHLHGIRDINEPTAFKVGSQYEYSQIGFELLSKIVEKTSGKSFAELSTALFKECGLKSTFHPEVDSSRINSYTENHDGVLVLETQSLKNYVAAGAFISTAADLLKWNRVFYSGKLFSPSSFKILTTKQEGAVRNHPLFGTTAYGYGITVDTKDGILQYGQTGYAPGFVSMNFYYPEKDVSLIILSNVVWDDDDINSSFYYHMKIWNAVRASL